MMLIWIIITTISISYSLNIKSIVDIKLDALDSIKNIFSTKTLVSKKLSTVAITGASGMVGSALKKRLESQDIKVISITRTLANSDPNSINWNLDKKTIDEKKLEGVDAIIHLAGEGVASGEGPLAFLGRWTDNKKESIMQSRIKGTQLIVDAISQLKVKPKLFISASAIGYYPYNEPEVTYDESSSSGEGFLSKVCQEWEKEALRAEKYGVRTVCARFGIVLSSNGGILKKLVPLFLVGGGGVIGSGRQGLSPVSLNDLVNALIFILEEAPSLRGPVNICSPEPVDNEVFTQALGRQLNRPTIFPLPEIVAKLVFGQMGEEMLLGGQKVLPKKLLKEGFVFKDRNISDALKNSL